jgi:chromate transporter
MNEEHGALPQTSKGITHGTAQSTPLAEIARLFLKLGTIAFGGPAAHIAMMEDEVVRRRGWLTREEFLDYLGATNLIPGPNSTELAIHIGNARAGWRGLLVAGACFILPASIIVGVIAWAYVRFGTLPAAAGLLYGVKPVVIAVVLQALLGLGRTALKTMLLVALGIASAAAAALGVNELVVLLAAGALMAFVRAIDRWRTRQAGADGSPMSASVLLFTAHARLRDAFKNLLTHREKGAWWAATGAITGSGSVASFSLWTLFGVFVKIGAVLFGSGYVLLAFLHADLVERLRWLTERQLLDAVAVGQFTPGPVFTTATFIGYVLGGAPGAAIATIGIFLPAFVFVALSGLLLPRLRQSPTTRAVLDGVNVASLALMGVVTWELGKAALIDPLSIGMAALSTLLLFRFRVNSAWLILGGAMVGLLVRG